MPGEIILIPWGIISIREGIILNRYPIEICIAYWPSKDIMSQEVEA